MERLQRLRSHHVWIKFGLIGKSENTEDNIRLTLSISVKLVDWVINAPRLTVMLSTEGIDKSSTGSFFQMPSFLQNIC